MDQIGLVLRTDLNCNKVIAVGTTETMVSLIHSQVSVVNVLEVCHSLLFGHGHRRSLCSLPSRSNQCSAGEREECKVSLEKR